MLRITLNEKLVKDSNLQRGDIIWTKNVELVDEEGNKIIDPENTPRPFIVLDGRTAVSGHLFAFAISHNKGRIEDWDNEANIPIYKDGTNKLSYDSLVQIFYRAEIKEYEHKRGKVNEIALLAYEAFEKSFKEKYGTIENYMQILNNKNESINESIKQDDRYIYPDYEYVNEINGYTYYWDVDEDSNEFPAIYGDIIVYNENYDIVAEYGFMYDYDDEELTISKPNNASMFITFKEDGSIDFTTPFDNLVNILYDIVDTFVDMLNDYEDYISNVEISI